MSPSFEDLEPLGFVCPATRRKLVRVCMHPDGGMSVVQRENPKRVPPGRLFDVIADAPKYRASAQRLAALSLLDPDFAADPELGGRIMQARERVREVQA